MAADDVRERMIALALGNDRGAFIDACRDHRDEIAGRFSDWKTVPEELRASRDSVERYVGGLLEIARVFETELADPSLLALLTGQTSTGSNPIERWHEELQSAQDEMEAGRFAEAAEQLERLVGETENLRGSFVDRYLPVTLGMLGNAYFNQGLLEEAEDTMRRALDLSREVDDAEGIEAYTANLLELHRYRGEGRLAADRARELADAVEPEQPRRAQRLRVRAARMEAGEPKLRVVLRLGDDPDAEYEVEEIEQLVHDAASNDQIRFLFERDRVGLAASAALTDEGHTLVERGKPESALALFRRATAIDPHDPAPHHEVARLQMSRQRWDAAVEALRAVEMRAPGWPMVREDLALVESIRDGTQPPTLLTTLQALEDSDRPVRAKLDMATQALESLGDHARLWLARGRALVESSELEEARESFAEAVECADEPSVRTRALVALAEVTPVDDARRLVTDAIDTAGDPVATAAAQLRLALADARAH